MKKLLIILSIMALSLSACTNNEASNGEPEAQPSIPEVTAEDWSKGNLDSEIVLVEYSDFQCPACKARLPLIEKILEEFSSHIKFVYRHMPLTSIHNNAMMAAQATEAAGMQDKFWEMHDMLFEKQSEWSGLSKSDFRDELVVYAEEIALDIVKFAEDLESGAVEDLVDEDRDGAKAAEVNSTPTFYFNGEQINPKTYEEYREIIREGLEQ